LQDEKRFTVMDHIDLKAEVVQRKDAPNSWGVEAIDGEGSIYMAVFSGPMAKERAFEYARSKFKSTLHTTQ
jgi:hypothetical protein